MKINRILNRRKPSNNSAFTESLACSEQKVMCQNDVYTLGVLMRDSTTLQYLKKLASMQAIAMQSLQINHQKRALRYLAAIRYLRKTTEIPELQIRQDITAQLLERQNDLKQSAAVNTRKMSKR